MDNILSKIDGLLEKPCYLIDIFPRTVPETPDRRYFAVEEIFQRSRPELVERFCRILLKLYCYYDFLLVDGAACTENPAPAALLERAAGDLTLLLPVCGALVMLSGDDLYLRVYHPDRRLAELLAQLAGAEGLFFYRAP